MNIAGRIWDGKRGIPRATITIISSDGGSQTTQSNSFGYYRLENVLAGDSYVFNVRAKNYLFNPQIVTVTEGLTNFNFTAQPVSGLSMH